mmetsp:Transcript_10829/g.23073  ORF Transcript_10829/g.23073 Transcript_10829/m.23073 type:complete len:167 (+) Transcript_10829:988-1488(+)
MTQIVCARCIWIRGQQQSLSTLISCTCSYFRMFCCASLPGLTRPSGFCKRPSQRAATVRRIPPAAPLPQLPRTRCTTSLRSSSPFSASALLTRQSLLRCAPCCLGPCRADPTSMANLITCMHHLRKSVEANRYTAQLKAMAPTHPWVAKHTELENSFARCASQFSK